MLSFLNKPYPHTDNTQKNLIASLLIGVFVAFFLIVFQPFGLSQWEDEHKFMKLAGYGMVSCVIPILMYAGLSLLPKKELEDNWKVWKELMNITAVILCIAAGNLFYSDLVGIGSITFKNYVTFIGLTFAIGIFPITLGVITKYNRFRKLNEATASRINAVLARQPVMGSSATEEQKGVVLVAENEKDHFKAGPHELLYLEAADNYTEIAYLKAGAAKKVLLRGSLKRMEQQLLPFPFLVRCHRAFIVNLENVTQIEGNAAGYRLSLRNTSNQVPVSRTFGPEITEKLNRIRQQH